jgi:hypothetical protein
MLAHVHAVGNVQAMMNIQVIAVYPCLWFCPCLFCTYKVMLRAHGHTVRTRAMLYVDVNAACLCLNAAWRCPCCTLFSYPCCMSMSILHFCVCAAFPCLCCISVSVLHVHVCGACPCLWCMFMSVPHVHIRAEFPCTCSCCATKKKKTGIKIELRKYCTGLKVRNCSFLHLSSANCWRKLRLRIFSCRATFL